MVGLILLVLLAELSGGMTDAAPAPPPVLPPLRRLPHIVGFMRISRVSCCFLVFYLLRYFLRYFLLDSLASPRDSSKSPSLAKQAARLDSAMAS